MTPVMCVCVSECVGVGSGRQRGQVSVSDERGRADT